MANFEYQNDVGAWTFHSEILSSKFIRMSENEEANHQNKPRTVNQYESTFEVTGENEGAFVEIAHLQPDYTVMLFGVHVLDSDDFAGVVLATHLLFPSGDGIGPFLRPPVVKLSGSAFTVSDANGGSSWQTADIASAVARDAEDEWLLLALAQPFAVTGVDNFKAGLTILERIGGFDGNAGNAPSAGTNYYVFWHAIGPVAAYL